MEAGQAAAQRGRHWPGGGERPGANTGTQGAAESRGGGGGGGRRGHRVGPVSVDGGGGGVDAGLVAQLVSVAGVAGSPVDRLVRQPREGTAEVLRAVAP